MKQAELYNWPNYITRNPLYLQVIQRLWQKNQNWLATVCGATGTGKSWVSLKIAYDCDIGPDGTRRFPLDASRIAFTPEEFLDLVQSDLPRGSFLIFDEAALALNSRAFMTKENLAMSYVSQSFRFKNYACLFAYPGTIAFLDKQVRQLSHHIIIMKGVSQKKQKSYGKVQTINVDEFGGKIYRQNLHMTLDGTDYKCNHFYFAQPPQQLIDSYEAKKRAFLDKFYKNCSVELDNVGGSKLLDLNKYFELAKSNLEEYMDGKTVSRAALRVKLSLSPTNAATLAQALELDLKKRRLSRGTPTNQ